MMSFTKCGCVFIYLYPVADDEPFSFGMALTLFLQLIQSKIDFFTILDRLCLSV